MESRRWQRVQELFETAADLAPPAQAAHLEAACAGDETLRREVEALLRSDAEAGSFIEQAIRRGSDLLLAADPDPLESLGKVGKYEILGRIGEGGFGVVYKGRDPVLQRYVAVKTCSSKDERLRRRFFREGQIAAGLQHPNITTLHDLGVEHGIPYLVQEFLDGEDLDRTIARREPLTCLQRLDILLQVARGLDYAHLQGVLHRDVKPANIRILPGGAVKIMDFGIAKLLHEVSEVTSQGMTLGTVGYLAPEQLRGEEVDRRTDVFAYGVLVYELLTYERPFPGGTFSEVSYRLLNEEPRALRDLAPEYSPRLAELANRCLAKEPRRRYGSFGEVIATLEPEIEALRSGSFVVAARGGDGEAVWGPPASGAGRGRDRDRDRVATRLATGGKLAAAMVVLAGVLGVGGRAMLRHQQAGGARAQAPAGGATSAAVRGGATGSPAVAGSPGWRAPGGSAGAVASPGGAAGTLRAEEGSGVGRGGSPERGAETGPASARGAGEGPAPPPQRPPPARLGKEASSRRATAGGERGAKGAGGAGAPRGAGTAAAPAAARRETAVLETGQQAPQQAGVEAEKPGAPAPAPAAGPGAGPWRAPAAAGGAGEAGQASGESEGEPAPLNRPMARGDLIPPGAAGAVPPRLLSRPEPQYPDWARRRQVEADVMILVLVDENGRVIRAIVKRTDDPGRLGFNDAARHAALRARFAPALRDGLPGKMWTELPFSFRLRG
jgi:TonB family protein